jgi:hypothetical protein
LLQVVPQQKSVWKPSQSGPEPPQRQLPEEQDSLVSQMVVQLPQCISSVSRLTQLVPQQ